MHTLLDNFHQGGKYSAQIASHQAELRRKWKFTDQKYLSISSLHNDYLDLYRSSCSGRNNERKNLVQIKCTFCGGTNHYADFLSIRKDKEKACAGGYFYMWQT